ncbi:MAG: hypothetical protein SW833_07425 [Cyanobacteriota bacterium]|nr:hypothetical protein [Cyanobacteriota bacterium]
MSKKQFRSGSRDRRKNPVPHYRTTLTKASGHPENKCQWFLNPAWEKQLAHKRTVIRLQLQGLK